MKNKIIQSLGFFKKNKRRSFKGKYNFFSKQKKTRSLVDEKPYKRRKKQLTLNFQKVNIKSVVSKNLLYIYSGLGVFFILGIIFIIFGPIFKVENINIIRQDDITNIDISYNAVNSFRNQGIFTIDPANVENKLKKYQENIKNIEIETILPNTLKIVINSYIGLFNTIYKDKNYLITQNGSYVPSKPKNELKTLEVIDNSSKNNFIDYKQILKPQNIIIIDQAIKKLEENILGLEITNITYYKIQRELHITLSNKTLLIYGLDNIMNQIEKTAIFSKEQLDIIKSNLIYIDFRIKNKVFYCDSESEFQCKLNIKKIYSNE